MLITIGSLEKNLTRGLLALSGAFLFSLSANAAPEMFSNLLLDDAKAKAHEQGKLLIIDFTASWCGPCHKMDETTWSADKVKEWMANNAIAIQLDVDKDKAIAESFKIEAMPTVVVFTPGDQSKEFDRQLGYESPAELLDWLGDVKKGRTHIARMKEALASVEGKGGDKEVQARYEVARELAGSGDYSGAAEQFIWLWKNIPKQSPPMVGVRSSYMVRDMAGVLKNEPATRPAFEKLRDDAAGTDRSDWITLNGLLGESDKTLAWFDKAKDDPSQRKAVDKASFLIEDLLVSKGRWADIAALYPDPMARLKEQSEFSKKVQESMKEVAAQLPPGLSFDPFPKSAGQLYAGYLAANKDSDADAITQAALKIENTAPLRQTLVSTAVKAKQVRQEPQTKLLDDEDIGTDPYQHMLRGRLYSKVGASDKAVKDLDLAIDSHDQKCGAARVLRGAALLGMGKTDAAIADLDAAIKEDPHQPYTGAAYIYRSRAYEKLGRTEDAAKDLDMAKKLGFSEKDAD